MSLKDIRVSFVVLMLAVPLRTASGQVLGLPVHNAGVVSGIGIYGEGGWANDDYGKATTFGGTVAAGFGKLGVTGTISSYNPDAAGPNVTSYGGTLNFRVFGGPLVPFSVTLQGGVGYAKPVGGVETLHFPVGAGIALNLPTPGLAIRPWIAPRADVLHTSVSGTSNTDTKFGLSAGVDFSLLMGLAFRASYDMVFADNGQKPGIFGVGIGYHLNVPL